MDKLNQRNIGRKVLFACVPADGHFNPLTGLAKHLQNAGYDVRWYTQDLYKDKLALLGIKHYPYIAAPQLNQHNFETFFTDRTKHKSQPAKLRFDLEHCFIRPAVTMVTDLQQIYEEFRFDIVIADIFSFSIPLVKSTFRVPVIAVGVVPVMQTSKDLPPSGLGLTPSTNLFGRVKQSALHWVTNQFIFKKPTKLYREILAQYGTDVPGNTIFDVLYNSADIVLQIGTPGFEYERSDLSKNICYIGCLLPHRTGKERKPWFDARLEQYERVVLVTQGTVEKDINKIIVPTLEAYKDTGTLVVCTTGGSRTAELRERYKQSNIIIEDFVPFADIMPYADAYVTNGGYGGVMLGIENELPMVVAGVHEGKNEICARIGHFKYGINLRTETPSAKKIRGGVEEVIGNPLYKTNIRKLRKEFATYSPHDICEKFVSKLLN